MPMASPRCPARPGIFLNAVGVAQVLRCKSRRCEKYVSSKTSASGGGIHAQHLAPQAEVGPSERPVGTLPHLPVVSKDFINRLRHVDLIRGHRVADRRCECRPRVHEVRDPTSEQPILERDQVHLRHQVALILFRSSSLHLACPGAQRQVHPSPLVSVVNTLGRVRARLTVPQPSSASCQPNSTASARVIGSQKPPTQWASYSGRPVTPVHAMRRSLSGPPPRWGQRGWRWLSSAAATRSRWRSTQGLLNVHSGCTNAPRRRAVGILAAGPANPDSWEPGRRQRGY